MLKTLAGACLVAAATAGVIAAPASASSSTDVTANAQLISTKVYFGTCEDTCRIKVRIRNKSGRTLYNVKMNAKLRVNGTQAGTCYDYVGIIRPYRVKWASCTVRTAKLTRLWNEANDYGDNWNRYANTYVSYKYYYRR